MTIAGLTAGTTTGATPDDILLITPSTGNVVKRVPIANLIGAEQGITYNESNSGKLRLGALTNSDATFSTAERFINQGDYALNFTYTNGATPVTMLKLNDGTATITAKTDITGATSVTGNTTLAGELTQTGAGNQVTFNGNVDANNGLDVAGATSLGGTVTQTGSSNQVTLNGNVDAKNGLDVTGANLTVGTDKFTVDVSNGNTTIAGSATIKTSNELRFEDNDGTANYSTFKAGNQTANLEYTLPTSAPTAKNNVMMATAYSNPMTLAWSNPNAAVTYGVQSVTWNSNQSNVTLPTDATVIRVASTGNITLDGIAAPAADGMGRVIVIVNAGAGNLTLKHSTGSSANNQFKLPAGLDVVLAEDGSATLMYDTTSLKWRVLSVN
jgi:hypothetical protein